MMDKQREKVVAEIRRLEEEAARSLSEKFRHDRAVAVRRLKEELAYYDRCHRRKA